MDEPDPISEIELLSRNFLSQDSNLDEYDDIDATVLSPRRFPVDVTSIGKGVSPIVGGTVAAAPVTSPRVSRRAHHDPVFADDDDEEDNNTHSSSVFSASIPRTVQDIDKTLDEIRLRSSPEYNDFVFRSGNRQYFNGSYYDDESMSEASYLTNSNLYRELNKAHESFMDSLATLGFKKGDKHKTPTKEDPKGHGDDREMSTIDLKWLRSRVKTPNSQEPNPRRTKRYAAEKNPMDAYENNRVYSPEKHSKPIRHIEANENNEDPNNISGISGLDEEWSMGNQNHGRFTFDTERNDSSDAGDDLNLLGIPGNDPEANPSRRHRRQRRKKPRRQDKESKGRAWWCQRRNQPKQGYQHQPSPMPSPLEKEEPKSSPGQSRTSRKPRKLIYCATICAVLAIAVIIVAVLFSIEPTNTWFRDRFQSTKTWFQNRFQEPQNSTSVVTNEPPWLDTNSTTIELDGRTDDRENSSTTDTDAPTALPTEQIMITSGVTPAPTRAPTAMPSVIESTNPPILPISEDIQQQQEEQQQQQQQQASAGSTIDVADNSVGNTSEPSRPVQGPLPVSGGTTNVEYVASNQKPPAIHGDLPVSERYSNTNSHSIEFSGHHTVSWNGEGPPPTEFIEAVFANLPVAASDGGGRAFETFSKDRHYHPPREEDTTSLLYQPANEKEVTASVFRERTNTEEKPAATASETESISQERISNSESSESSSSSSSTSEDHPKVEKVYGRPNTRRNLRYTQDDQRKQQKQMTDTLV